jgi:hypothetical protein
MSYRVLLEENLTITPDPKYFANLGKDSTIPLKMKYTCYLLENILWDMQPRTLLGKHRKHRPAQRTYENNKNRGDPKASTIIGPSAISTVDVGHLWFE